MSTIETIFARMMNETEFAKSVFTDAGKALAEYNLSADELEKISGLTRAQFETMTIDERKSMIGGWGSSVYQYSFPDG